MPRGMHPPMHYPPHAPQVVEAMLGVQLSGRRFGQAPVVAGSRNTLAIDADGGVGRRMHVHHHPCACMGFAPRECAGTEPLLIGTVYLRLRRPRPRSPACGLADSRGSPPPLPPPHARTRAPP